MRADALARHLDIDVTQNRFLYLHYATASYDTKILTQRTIREIAPDVFLNQMIVVRPIR